MNTRTKFLRFLRNNVALIIIILSVLTIASVLMISYFSQSSPPDDFSSVGGENNPDSETPNPDDGPIVNNPDVPDTSQPTVETFSSPVEYISVGMEYSDGVEIIFVYNSTLDKWTTHRALDLLTQDNAEVLSMKSGTVVEVGNNYGYGEYVVIDHGDGVVATYASLTNVQVVEGDVLEKGELLGYASSSASYEFSQGAHLHLEVEKNGEKVDPRPYVDGTIENN